MKIIKYFVLLVLIISVSKRMFIHAEDSTVNLPFTSAFIDPKYQSSIIGSYNPENQTATITFNKVTKHERTVTPPNISNPDLIIIGTMPNPQYNQATSLIGGLLPTTTLYGIPTYGTPSNNEFTINIQESDFENINGMYNPENQTATIRFNVVTEYKRAVTPPNISNKSMIAFGIMPTIGYEKPKAHYTGGLSPNTILYGIPTTSTPSDTSSSENETDSVVLRAPQEYNQTNRTALMQDGSTYISVIEYSQAVTPPNIKIPALKPFAKIETSKKTKSKTAKLGSKQDVLTLYGIKVEGSKIPVKNPSNHIIIGYYWPQSKMVQRNNGETYINIKAKRIKSSSKKDKKTDSPQDWFIKENKDLSSFGISKTQENFVNLIGTKIVDLFRNCK